MLLNVNFIKNDPKNNVPINNATINQLPTLNLATELSNTVFNDDGVFSLHAFYFLLPVTFMLYNYILFNTIKRFESNFLTLFKVVLFITFYSLIITAHVKHTAKLITTGDVALVIVSIFCILYN